jgi:antitoxin component YwqK of YwqJK toxin-antitoxin module
VKSYYENGKIQKDEYYIKGKLQNSKEYDRNGNILSHSIKNSD